MKIFFAGLLFLWTGQALALDVEQSPKLERLFKKAGVTGTFVLYGKTGWTTTPDPDIGWWVGWVTSEGSVFSFALNIDMPDKGDVVKRVELGKACLKELGIF